MAEKLSTSENNNQHFEMPSKQEAIKEWKDKQSELVSASDAAYSKARNPDLTKPEYKLASAEYNRADAKLEEFNTQWRELGGEDIDTARQDVEEKRLAAETPGFRATANDKVSANIALRDARNNLDAKEDAFYANLQESVHASEEKYSNETGETVDPVAEETANSPENIDDVTPEANEVLNSNEVDKLTATELGKVALELITMVKELQGNQEKLLERNHKLEKENDELKDAREEVAEATETEAEPEPTSAPESDEDKKEEEDQKKKPKKPFWERARKRMESWHWSKNVTNKIVGMGTWIKTRWDKLWHINEFDDMPKKKIDKK